MRHNEYIDILNIQQAHCVAADAEHGTKSAIAKEQRAYTKGLRDAYELITGNCLDVDSKGFYIEGEV